MTNDADTLFKLPLGEFTSARNALVSKLKKAGLQTEAAEVKALPKPSVSAWVVNQLYWRHGYLFGRLFEAGERLRQAQATRRIGNTARELVETRREVLAALATTAADILRETGYSDARDVMRRVTSTLEALSAYGSRPGAPTAGRLTGDLQPPGFDTLAAFQPQRDATELRGMQPTVRRPHARGAKKPLGGAQPSDAAAHRRERQRLVAASRNAVRKAERELGVARQQAERAAAKLKAAAAHAKKSEARRVELGRQLAIATEEATAARDRSSAAEAEAREAAQAAGGAEKALQLERTRLEQLEGKQT